MAEPQQVVLENPQGEIVTVPPEQAAAALQVGFKTTTPEAYQQAVWAAQHQTTGQQIATGAEGVIQGAIPGAATAEAALGVSPIAEQAARRQVNPTIAAGSRIVGAGLQMAGVAAATGGLGDLAEGLGAGAEAASDVAGGAEAADAAAAAGGTQGAVSAAADTAAAQGPTSLADALLKNKAMGYAEQAAAGAVQGGTGYVNETELGDHDFNGQALAQEIGLGALLGVGGEAGINVLGEKVLPPVLRKAGDVLDAANDKARSAWFKMTAGLSGSTPEKLEEAYQAIKSGVKPFTRDAADAFAEGANDAKDQLAQQSKALENEYRPKEVAKNLRDVSTDQILGPAPEQLNVTGSPDQLSTNAAGGNGLHALNDRIDQTIGEIKQTGTEGFKSVLNAIDDARSSFQAKINATDATPESLNAATRDFGKQVGAIQSQLKVVPGITPPDTGIMIGKIKGIYGAIKDNLKDAEVWGPAQAERQAALDKSIRQVINNGNQVAKDFGFKEIDPDTGKLDWDFKASKIFSALKERADPLANQEKIEHLGDWIESIKAHSEEIKTSAGTAGAVVPGGDDLHDLLDHLTAQRAAGQAYAPIADLLKQTREQPAWGLGAGGAAPIAGVVAHAAGLSIPGAAALAAPIAAIRSPVKAMQAFAKIASTAATAKQVIGSAVRKTFANAPARVAITGAVETSLRGRTIQSKNGVAAGQDFQRQAKHISELAANQQDQMNRLAANTSRIADVAPNTTQAMHQAAIAGLNVLAQNLPKNPAPSLLASENKNWEPSQQQVQQWDDLHSAILKPQSYLAKLSDGTADPAVWGALQQAYPAWTKEVQSQTLEHIQTHPKLELDPGQKLTASMILGVPISPSVDPAQVSWQQGLFATTPPPAHGKSPHAGRNPTQSGLAHLDVAQRTSLNPQEKA